MMSFDALVCRVTAGGAGVNTRIGLYALDLATGLPSRLLIESANLDVSTTGIKISPSLGGDLHLDGIIALSSVMPIPP